MGRTKFNSSLILITAFLVLLPVSKTELLPRPMPNPLPPESYHPFCISQFALANHACAPIRYGPVPQQLLSSTGFIKLHRVHHHGHSHGQSHSQRRHGHHENHHEHHHHHHHEHHDIETEAAKECCKWLKAVNDYCVCDLLIRLPNFLSRPIHGFVVVVDDVCKIEYKCPGRFMTSR